MAGAASGDSGAFAELRVTHQAGGRPRLTFPLGGS